MPMPTPTMRCLFLSLLPYCSAMHVRVLSSSSLTAPGVPRHWPIVACAPEELDETPPTEAVIEPTAAPTTTPTPTPATSTSGTVPIAAAAAICALFLATGSPCDEGSFKAALASPEACAEKVARQEGTSTWKTSFDEYGDAIKSFKFSEFDKDLTAMQAKMAGR